MPTGIKEVIVKYNPDAEYYTDERCFINVLLESPNDEKLSIARARVEPGVTTIFHHLKGIEEHYIIISGSGQVEIGQQPVVEVCPGDVVCIPPQTRQRITNTGEEDLVFLCICTPPFNPDCYEDLGD